MMVGKTSAYSSPVLNTDSYQVDESLIKPRYSSISYEPNTNYNICSCDMVAESCDPFCCCDQKCPQNIRDEWSTNQRCKDVKYPDSVKQVKMFSDCFNQEEQYKFNNQQGLNTYFDPFLKLVCVAIRNAPEMDYYYLSKPMDAETKNSMI